MTSRLTQEDLDVVRRLIDERVASILSSQPQAAPPAEEPAPPPPPERFKSSDDWRAIVTRHLDTLRLRLGTTHAFHLAEARGILVRQCGLNQADRVLIGKRERWIGQFQNAIDSRFWPETPFIRAEGKPRGWYRLRSSTEIVQGSLLGNGD
jgi:hypothetical protein